MRRLIWILWWLLVIVGSFHRAWERASSRARSPRPTVAALRLPRQSLTPEEFFALRALFEKGEHDRLTQELDRLYQAARADVRLEFPHNDSYRVFARPGPEELARLDAWQKRMPRSFHPLLARARYRSELAYASRGTRSARETTPEQFRLMNEHLAAAEKDLTAALAIETRLMPAYWMLIGIHANRAERSGVLAMRKLGLVLFPTSYSLRARLLWFMSPRWRGSYPEMEEVAKEADAHVAANPRLAALRGFIELDQADQAERRKAYAEAEKLLTRAIERGEDSQFFADRADLRFQRLDRNDLALADIESAIRIRPSLPSIRILAARIHFNSERNEKALEEYELARRLAPGDDEVKTFGTEAAEDLEKEALALQRTDPSAAVALLELALRFDARRFETVQALDRVLFPRNELDAILAHWDRFLALQPDHAGALFERAGTHHHRGNAAQSQADLKRACALGSKGACEQLGSR